MAIQEIVCALFKFGKVCNTLPTDKLLIEYLLVPAVISIIMFYVISGMFIRNLQMKIQALVSITFFIVFVYSGLFGIIAPIMYTYVLLFIMATTVLFFATRVISPSKMEDLSRGAMALGGKAYDRKTIHDRVQVKLKELDSLKEMANDLKSRGLLEEKDLAIIEMLMHESRIELNILMDQLKRSSRISPILRSSDMELLESQLRKVDQNIETANELVGRDQEEYRNRIRWGSNSNYQRGGNIWSKRKNNQK